MNRLGANWLLVIGACATTLACQTQNVVKGPAKDVAECIVTVLKKIPTAQSVSYRTPSDREQNSIAIVDYVYRNEDARRVHVEISIEPEGPNGVYPFLDFVTWTQGLSPDAFSDLDHELITKCHAQGYFRISLGPHLRIT